MGNVFWGDKECILVEVCHNRRPSMLPVTITHSWIFVMHCVINIQDEKDHPAIQQCTAPQCSSVHGEDSEEWLGTCPPFTLLCRPSPIWLQSVDGHKGSDMRPALWNQPAIYCHLWSAETLCNQQAKHCHLWNAETVFYCKGIFKLLEWWQNCDGLDGDFLEKYIQWTDFTYMWCFPIHTFTWLWN